MKCSVILTPIPCAVLFCLANAFKPAVIDDTAYLWFANQIALTPSEPYGPPPDGFRLIWYDRGQSAYTLLAPQVVPYWIGLGIALFDDNLVFVKLWLLPFCLLFTSGLYSIVRRFAPGLEKTLMALTVVSPTFLPSLNVMIDVPAIALNLTTIAVFCRALDGPKPCWRLVVMAGLTAGLAAQTKYTGATSLAVILLYGLTRRQRLAPLLAIAIAVSLFIGWEAYLSHAYGRSHFLLHLEKQRSSNLPNGPEAAKTIEFAAMLEKKADMTIPLFGFLGGLGLPMIPLFLLGMRFRSRNVRIVAATLYAAFLLLMLLPGRWSEFYRDERHPHVEVTFGTLLMGLAGLWFGLTLAGCTLVLALKGNLRIRRSGPCWFLIGWLLIELLAFYALSPFAATRRVMGIMVATTVLLGRLLATIRDPNTIRLVHRLCACGVGIGLIYAWTDYRDAVAERDALKACVNHIRAESPANARVWFTGHWGFQYYGEREGLRAIYPCESMIEAGDWIIIPDTPPRPYAQPLRLEMPFAQKQYVVEIFDAWPLSTNPIYYDGYMPIRRHDGGRLRIAVFRANQRFLAWPN